MPGGGQRRAAAGASSARGSEYRVRGRGRPGVVDVRAGRSAVARERVVHQRQVGAAGVHVDRATRYGRAVPTERAVLDGAGCVLLELERTAGRARGDAISAE